MICARDRDCVVIDAAFRVCSVDRLISYNLRLVPLASSAPCFDATVSSYANGAT